MICFGQSALVTGTGSGIGRAIALALAREGASVLAMDRSKDSAQETAVQIRSNGGQAKAHVLDVTQPDDHRSAVAAPVQAFGKLNTACNCAGITAAKHLQFGLLAELENSD